jgi:hypothetical protein
MIADAIRIESDSVEVHHLAAVGAVPGVVPLLAAAKNGPGVGVLSFNEDGTLLTWQAPGSSTPGDAVDCSADGNYVLTDGEDRDKWLRVEIHAAYCEPVRNANVLLSDRYNNGLSGRDTTAAEAAAGHVLEYSIALRNTHTERVSNLRVWIDSGGDDHTALSWDGVNWSLPYSYAAGVWRESIAPAATALLYLRRTIPAAESADPKQPVRLQFAFDLLNP